VVDCFLFLFIWGKFCLARDVTFIILSFEVCKTWNKQIIVNLSYLQLSQPSAITESNFYHYLPLLLVKKVKKELIICALENINIYLKKLAYCVVVQKKA